MIKIMLVLLF